MEASPPWSSAQHLNRPSSKSKRNAIIAFETRLLVPAGGFSERLSNMVGPLQPLQQGP